MSAASYEAAGERFIQAARKYLRQCDEDGMSPDAAFHDPVTGLRVRVDSTLTGEQMEEITRRSLRSAGLKEHSE